MKTQYLDAEGKPCAREAAAFDPHGRRMDRCISCPNPTTQHLTIKVEDTIYHTHVCDDCAAIVFSMKSAVVAEDPVFGEAA